MSAPIPVRVPCLIPDLPTAEELLPYLQRIDANRWYSNFGPLACEYEAELAAGLSAAEGHALGCAAVASGAAALELALETLALPAGSAVLTPALGFPATPAAILRAGLVPVFADVDATSWCLTPAIARAALARRPLAAVMPVATYGLPLPQAEWEAFQDETGVPVVVDAAAALGRQPVGRLRAVVFSLHATKPLGVGEGGLVVSADGDGLQAVRLRANFGFQDKQARVVAGNGKFSEYAAAVGLAQWRRREAVWARRAAVWRAYGEALEPLLARGVRLQPHGAAPGTLVLGLPQAAEPVLAGLAAEGIECRRWYCPPLHVHPAFATMAKEEMPVTRKLADQLLGLPFHGFLSPLEVQYVAYCISRFL